MSPFPAWGDFHARSRFARSTISEGNGGLLVVYKKKTAVSAISAISPKIAKKNGEITAFAEIN